MSRTNILLNEDVKEEKSDRKLLLLVVCIAVPVLIGVLSGFLTSDSAQIYETLNKPALSPPGIIFPIVWSILYVLMGIGSYLAIINSKDLHHKISILYPYVIQLILNFTWSLLFFNGGWYGAAFICLVFMWFMILWMMLFFGSVSKLSFVCTVPYLMWVTFAGYLNLGIALLN